MGVPPFKETPIYIYIYTHVLRVARESPPFPTFSDSFHLPLELQTWRKEQWTAASGCILIFYILFQYSIYIYIYIRIIYSY